MKELLRRYFNDFISVKIVAEELSLHELLRVDFTDLPTPITSVICESRFGQIFYRTDPLT